MFASSAFLLTVSSPWQKIEEYCPTHGPCCHMGCGTIGQWSDEHWVFQNPNDDLYKYTALLARAAKSLCQALGKGAATQSGTGTAQPREQLHESSGRSTPGRLLAPTTATGP